MTFAFDTLYQELKQDFSCYLMNVRILAKFLGFLLFQPYYGAETTSQVISTETLQIRNRVSHFHCHAITNKLKTIQWKKLRN